jgi:hypothetical protein
MITCEKTVLRGPIVGDRLHRVPSIGADGFKACLPCTVVYVNPRHGFYTVRFDLGFREAYRFV